MNKIITIEDFNLFERLKMDVSNLRSERNELLEFTDKVNLFFEKESIRILNKFISNIVSRLEAINTKFLGDDFEHLTLFEQICYVAFENELDYYWTVKDTISQFLRG